MAKTQKKTKKVTKPKNITKKQVSKKVKSAVKSSKSKAQTCLDLKDKKGKFVRRGAAFRNWISKDNKKFQPEKNRYHLYISWACPWANRCATVRVMKGLKDVISLSVVHPTW